LDTVVATNAELQAWWADICRFGLGNRQRDLVCWQELDTVANLAKSLSTLVWIASALHTAINFIQYAYAEFIPNRPTRSRRLISSCRCRTCRFFLDTVPDHFTTTTGVMLIEVLSNHTSDELYLGQGRNCGVDGRRG
jgi:lipoxygenase